MTSQAKKIPTSIQWCVVVSLLSLLLSTQMAHAALNDWAEGTSGKDDGATRDYYNRGARLAWKHRLGDWFDANGKAQGTTPFASATIPRDNKIKPVDWDVTNLVRTWLDGTHQNLGFYIKIKSGGPLLFYSREHTDQAQRPKLILQLTSGKRVTLDATADTYIPSSTYRAQGHTTTLRVERSLVRFDLSQQTKGTTITKATLRLTNYKQFGGSTATINVFRCQQGERPSNPAPTPGLAARYKDDAGIQRDPDVILFEDFEQTGWKTKWSSTGGTHAIIANDAARKFAPLQGKALRAKIAKGALLGLSLRYKFKQKNGSEPDEIFFRYYLRLANDWNQTVQGGKMPGIAGTYGKSGWGGRKADGTTGWSARGSFGLTIPKGANPLGGLTPLGFYVYHADMPGTFGEVWYWDKGYRGYVANNRWVCIEEYAKMNTVGKKDGILRVWIDGRPAYDKTDLQMRKVNALKIEEIWLNVYHGGKTASPYDQHLYIDNIVVARKYIGPRSSEIKRPIPPQPEPTAEPTQEPVAERPNPQETTPEPGPPTDAGNQTDSRPSDTAQPDPGNPRDNGSRRDVINQDTGTTPDATRDAGASKDTGSPNDTARQRETTPPSGCGCQQTEFPASLWLCILLFVVISTRKSTHTKSTRHA